MNLPMNLARIVFCAIVLASPGLGQAVFVVDRASGPGSTHTTISAAVAAAADGDFILVRQGIYPEDLVLDAKGLTVQAEAGVLVRVEHTIVRNLNANQTVAIRGIRWGFGERLMDLTDNRGPIWIEEAQPSDSFWASGRILGCESVVLRSCAFGSGFLNADGGPGLSVGDSTVALYECESRGGTVHTGNTPGSPGLHIDASVVTLYASTVIGGTGDSAVFGGGGGDGGPGILLSGGGVIDMVGSSICGGYPGADNRSMGPDFRVIDGTLNQYTSVPRILITPSPLRSEDTTTVTLTGVPGDTAFVLVASGPGAFSTFKQNVGPIVLPPGSSLVRLGQIPASGSLTRTVTAPTVTAGVSSFYLQGIFLNAALPEVGIGTPTQLHVLDPTL